MSLLDLLRRTKKPSTSSAYADSVNPRSHQHHSQQVGSYDELLKQYAPNSSTSDSNGYSQPPERDIATSNNHWRDFVRSGEGHTDPELDPLRNISAQVFIQIESLAKNMGIYREDFFAQEWFHRAQRTRVSAEHCLGVGIPWESILQEMNAHGTRTQQELATGYIRQMQALDLDFRRIEHSRSREFEQVRDIGFDR